MVNIVTVYTKPSCVQCNMTHRRLKALNIPSTSVDLTQDPAALAYTKGLGYMQAPVVTITDEEGNLLEHWSGFQPDSIDAIQEKELQAA